MLRAYRPHRPAGAYYAALALGAWLILAPNLAGTQGALAVSERLMGIIVLMMTMLVSGRRL